MKDFNICSGCYNEERFKQFVAMHPVDKKRKRSDIDHIGDAENCKAARECSCNAGPCRVCPTVQRNGKQCGVCKQCSCNCHKQFAMRCRFLGQDSMKQLIEDCEALAKPAKSAQPLHSDVEVLGEGEMDQVALARSLFFVFSSCAESGSHSGLQRCDPAPRSFCTLAEHKFRPAENTVQNSVSVQHMGLAPVPTGGKHHTKLHKFRLAENTMQNTRNTQHPTCTRLVAVCLLSPLTVCPASEPRPVRSQTSTFP